jgi:hypothetical protein
MLPSRSREVFGVGSDATSREGVPLRPDDPAPAGSAID